MSLLIEIKNLTKHYLMGDTLVRALDGVDLSIEQGEFVAITGASGSGKSTMMHLLGCLDRPTEGEYWLDGELVSAMSDRQLAIIRNQKIGFVFQTFNLIQRTSAIDNVAVPLFYARKSEVRAPSIRALERVGLSARGSHKPSELSGGERQRVAVARAIVNEPKILLADEPTGNLDSRTGKQIMGLFHELHRAGVTVLIVTHEMSVALQARRVIRMRDGKVIEDKTIDDETRRQALAQLDEESDAVSEEAPKLVARPVRPAKV
jgi:putative ABC transport system ATP-binding protein